ncbi:MAG TPA: hypothetical protein VHZ74_22460 [Bryobacteraceae bacterium]|nr:hypothetical protein [Bryobacteraceae bacterium]
MRIYPMRIVTLALVFTASAAAQWLNMPTPGIPRLANGKPNLTAPLPRMSDGKPDLSGLWQPELTPYRFDVIQDLKDEGIFRPAAQALFLQRAVNLRHDNPVTHCLPAGPQAIFAAGSTRFYRIVQSPGVIALLYELGGYRQIYTDGRALPKDPNPTWTGYSVGHWEDGTLVVETAGFNDKTWLDMVGHPHSERLRVTEKFRRTDFGHMQVQVTYDDPETMTRPLTISVAVNYAADGDMLEYVCNEDEQDTKHLVGTAKAAAHPNPALLDRYVGRYEFREGVRSSRDFFGPNQIVSVQQGQLYMKDFPLIPTSETTFDSTAGTIEFHADSSGRVTHLTLSAAEGDARYDRIR